MFHGDAVGDMLGGEQTFAAAKLFKHFRQTFVEVKIRPQFFEFVIGRPIHPELIEQDLHVGEFVVVAMVAHELGTTPPENLAVNSKRRKHHLVLHVARTQCLVVIIDDGDGILRSGHGRGRESQIVTSLHRELD